MGNGQYFDTQVSQNPKWEAVTMWTAMHCFRETQRAVFGRSVANISVFKFSKKIQFVLYRETRDVHWSWLNTVSRMKRNKTKGQWKNRNIEVQVAWTVSSYLFVRIEVHRTSGTGIKTADFVFENDAQSWSVTRLQNLNRFCCARAVQYSRSLYR